MILRAFGTLTLSVGSVMWLNGQVVEAYGDALRHPRAQITPKSYMASPNSRYEVAGSTSTYSVNYAFKGLKTASMKWSWSHSKAQVDGLVSSYGIPKSMLNPYSPTPDVVADRQKQLLAGCFRQDGAHLRPNYRELIRTSRPVVETVAQLFDKQQPDANLTDRVNFVLNFCQDLPYGIPPSEIDGKLNGGLLPPAGVLSQGWGDCDSKATLFGTLMSFYPNAKMVMVAVPGHQLVGIRAQAVSGQDSIQFEGEEYVLCEPVGLARLPMGKKSKLVTTIEWTRRVLPYE